MKKILVIEDEPQIRNDLQEMLELHQFEVYTAERGALGLQLAKVKLPDLILCDIAMPEMDGYEVVTALRQDSVIGSTPVIFLTAKQDRNDIRRGMELGADDFLIKPFVMEELLRAITSRLERQQAILLQWLTAQQKTKQLKLEVHKNQQQLQQSQQLIEIKDELLQKLVQDLRSPLSNISMAIRMLEQAQSDADRQRYLSVLREECSREVQLLNEIEELRKLLTPANAQLLQRFKLLSGE